MIRTYLVHSTRLSKNFGAVISEAALLCMTLLERAGLANLASSVKMLGPHIPVVDSPTSR